MAAGLVAFLVLGPAAPASAAPTVDVTTAGAPDPGDVIPITVDGADGYDGAHLLAITSCGNATALSGPTDGPVCHDLAPTVIADGDAFSGVGLLPIPVDGTDYAFDYEWTEPFGADGICAATAPVACRIRVAGIRLDGTVRWTRDIEVSSPQPLPRVALGAPVAVTEGDVGVTDLDIPLELSRQVEWWVRARVDLVGLEATTFTYYPEVDPLDIRVRFPWNLFDPRIPPGSTSGVLGLEVHGDTIDEFDERAVTRIRETNGAEIGGFYGLSAVTIVDDDDPPELLPASVAVAEGADGPTIAEVTLRLSQPSQKTVEFDWTVISAGSAEPGVDFVPASGHAIIAPGGSSGGDGTATIAVELIGDQVPEPNETVLVAVSDVVNARPGGLFGLSFVEIVNDDDPGDCLDRLGPGADLAGCDLSGQVLSGVDLSGADLRYADLSHTFFAGGSLAGADLTGVATTGTAFVGADLSEARVGADAAVVFFGSTLDGAIVVGDHAGSLFAGGTAISARFDGTFAAATFATIDLRDAELDGGDFAGAVWGNTTCPDGELSNTTDDTCLRVAIQVRDWWTGRPWIVLDAPVPVIDVWVLGSAGISPLGDSTFRFGPSGVETGLEFGYLLGANGDPWLDSAWRADRPAAEFSVGDTRACVSGTTSDAERVWGCTPVTVTRWMPPTTTVTLPPMSPPVSPPVSGPAGGFFGGVVPLLQGPVGLMATAAGIGMVFLLGSSRTADALAAGRGDDDADDAPDDGD